jgi:hypothetical protein
LCGHHCFPRIIDELSTCRTYTSVKPDSRIWHIQRVLNIICTESNYGVGDIDRHRSGACTQRYWIKCAIEPYIFSCRYSNQNKFGTDEVLLIVQLTTATGLTVTTTVLSIRAAIGG